MRPSAVLDIPADFTMFATNKNKRRVKIVCRYQQYLAVKRIVERVINGGPRKGLIRRAKAALTELFYQAKNSVTPVIVERIVADIENIVRINASADLQTTKKSERIVRTALRRCLINYKLNTDKDLMERAYKHVKEY